MNSNKKIGIVGCKHTTKDLILGLRRAGIKIDHCVTIEPDKGAAQKVAGYYDLREFLAGHGIPFTVAKTYALKDAYDQEKLLSLKLDILFVAGWQRLIPNWWLRSLSVGAFGMHGSSKPLPHGRGRSPMNWSLIQNKDIFYTHLFRYDPGVDDGPIVGVQTFDITPFDDCLTLHFKNIVAMIKLVTANLPALLAGNSTFTAQSKEGASYYPKREAEDGIIHWDDPTLTIYNLVRAVTEPFPGAFTFLDDDQGKKVSVWEAIPFDTKLTWPAARPGEIVEVFFDEKFLVKTGDSTILVLRSEGHHFAGRDVGRRLGNLGRPRKVWKDLPA